MEDFQSKYSGEQVEGYLDQIANGEIGGGQTKLQVEITYAELIALRNDKKLVGGVEYRIVDYETTTTQDATQAMGHPFDIIVSALSESALSEKAKATHSDRDSDGYFATAAIGSWEIDYSLDNDKARFGWADETNGKGVIFRMVDEFGNECPYDFKNIMMREGYNSSNETYYYTFDNGGIDYSLNGAKCFSNIIKKYISGSQQINRIVFLCGNREVSDNRFDYQCYNNTMGDARSLHFARECYNNRFEGLNVACNIGPKFRNNYVGSESQGLTIGMSCTNNNIGKNNYYVVFEDYVRNCTTGKYTYYSRFGANSSYVIMGADSESTTTNIRRLVTEAGCSYIYISKEGIGSTTYVNDIKIHQGTSGSSSKYLSIILTKGNVEVGLNSSGVLVQFDSSDIANKQDELVSEKNIKTINGESILGSGNISIVGGSGGGSVYKWNWNSEMNGTFTEEEFESLKNADAIYISVNVAGIEMLYSIDGRAVVENALHLGVHSLSFETDTDNSKVAYVENITFIFDNSSKTWSVQGGNAELITNEQLTTALEDKQDAIEDLEDIKEGAYKGATALQGTETSEELDDVETNTFVKYVVQTLTETQRQQARNNIGAASTEYVLSLFNELKEIILSGGGGGVVMPNAILDSAILNNSKLV